MRTCFTLGAAVFGLAIVAPSAPAQWPSTATVECASASSVACTSLRFFVDAAGSNRLSSLAIFNNRFPLFDFGSIVSLTDASSRAVGWRSALIDLRSLSLEFFIGVGAPVLEPLFLTIALAPASQATAAQMGNGAFSYAATGVLGTTGTSPLVTSGFVTSTYVPAAPPPPPPPPPVTATPEPVTMLLLGSGLLGLGAARRRRRASGEEPSAE